MWVTSTDGEESRWARKATMAWKATARKVMAMTTMITTGMCHHCHLFSIIRLPRQPLLPFPPTLPPPILTPQDMHPCAMCVYGYHLVCRWWPAQWVFVRGRSSSMGVICHVSTMQIAMTMLAAHDTYSNTLMATMTTTTFCCNDDNQRR